MELEGKNKSQVSRLSVNGFCSLNETAGKSAAEIWVGDSDWLLVHCGAVTLLHNDKGEVDFFFFLMFILSGHFYLS